MAKITRIFDGLRRFERDGLDAVLNPSDWLRLSRVHDAAVFYDDEYPPHIVLLGTGLKVWTWYEPEPREPWEQWR